jgi:hypothetical protein
MGFQMGDEDAPFSQRMWGLGARWVPSPRGRRGCMVMLIATFVLLMLVLIVMVLTSVM